MINTYSASSYSRQRGMALIAALLLLIVVTLLGVGMFRSYGLEQRIGGNTRDKEKAFHTATAGESVAEQWLTLNNGANAGTGSACAGVMNGNTTGGIQVCSNLIQSTVTDVSQVPWPSYVQYQLPNMTTGSATSVYGTYSQVPGFYIGYLSSTQPNESGIYSSFYQVDAVGYGASANSIAVVESTYQVLHTKTSEGVGPGQQPTKNVNQGGT